MPSMDWGRKEKDRRCWGPKSKQEEGGKGQFSGKKGHWFKCSSSACHCLCCSLYENDDDEDSMRDQKCLKDRFSPFYMTWFNWEVKEWGREQESKTRTTFGSFTVQRRKDPFREREREREKGLWVVILITWHIVSVLHSTKKSHLNGPLYRIFVVQVLQRPLPQSDILLSLSLSDSLLLLLSLSVPVLSKLLSVMHSCVRGDKSLTNQVINRSERKWKSKKSNIHTLVLKKMDSDQKSI